MAKNPEEINNESAKQPKRRAIRIGGISVVRIISRPGSDEWWKEYRERINKKQTLGLESVNVEDLFVESDGQVLERARRLRAFREAVE